MTLKRSTARSEFLGVLIASTTALGAPDAGVGSSASCESTGADALYIVVVNRNAQRLQKASVTADGQPLTRRGSCFSGSRAKLAGKFVCSATLYQDATEQLPTPTDPYQNVNRPFECELDMLKEHLEFVDEHGDPVHASKLDPARQKDYARALAVYWVQSGENRAGLAVIAKNTGVRPAVIVASSFDPKKYPWAKDDLELEKKIAVQLAKTGRTGDLTLDAVTTTDFKKWLKDGHFNYAAPPD